MRLVRRPSRWTLRLVLGAVLASVLLLSLLNSLVAWHLHVLEGRSDLDTHHVEALHAQNTATATDLSPSDTLERLCQALAHCPCGVAWVAGTALPPPELPLHRVRIAARATPFVSHHADVPLHPPNDSPGLTRG